MRINQHKIPTGTGTGTSNKISPGSVKKNLLDRDQKFLIGTIPGPGPEKSDFAVL